MPLNVVDRRKALSTMGKAAIGAAAVIIVGGVAYYAATQPQPTPSTVTVTQPTTTTVTSATTTTVPTTTVSTSTVPTTVTSATTTTVPTTTVSTSTVPTTVTSATTATTVTTATETVAIQRGGVLLYGGTTDIGQAGVLDIQNCYSAAAETYYASWNFFNGLCKMDSRANVVPDIAKSWKISGDGLSYTLYLNGGVRFWNGREFTAEDVKKNYDRIRRDKVFQELYIEDVDSVEAPDKYTAVIHLKRPNSSFLQGTLANNRQGMIDVEYLDQVGREEFERNPMGSGPFKHKEWIQDRYCEAVKNQEYWEEGKPYLDGYRVIPIPDPAVRLTAFRTGEVDAACDLSLKDLVGLEEEGKQGKINFLRVPGARPTPLFFHCQKPPFDDKRVRQAFAWAIDKQEIVDAVLFGYGSMVHQCLPPSSYYYLDEWPYKQDISKAKDLLADAGFPDGLKCECILISAIEDFVKSGEILHTQLLKAGIDMQLAPLDVTTWFDRWQNGDFETSICYWDAFIDPNDWLGVTNAAASVQNNGKYYNEKVEELFVKGREESDPEKRRAIYFELQRILNEDVPYIWYYTPDAVEVTQTYVHGHELMNPNLCPRPRYWKMWVEEPHRR